MNPDHLPTFSRLHSRGVIKGVSPDWLPSSIAYEVKMGSVAYGLTTDSSDLDLYGWVMPPLDDLFPHLRGELVGFKRGRESFQNFQMHHVRDGGQEYDFAYYGLPRYVALVGENNPNMVDSLFVPDECVTFTTPEADRLRELRKTLLHKGYYFKATGFARGQYRKMLNKAANPAEGTERAKHRAAHGYDVKFATHALRMALQACMVLEHGDLDLRGHRELLGRVRRGEMAKRDLESQFEVTMNRAQDLFESSTLPERVDTDRLVTLVLELVESRYGNIDNLIKFGRWPGP